MEILAGGPELVEVLRSEKSARESRTSYDDEMRRRVDRLEAEVDMLKKLVFPMAGIGKADECR